MNRTVPLLLVLALVVPARATGGPKPSNRTPGVAEPGSNWILLRTKRPEKGSVGSDQPFYAMQYWCHKSDCELRGGDKNRVEYGQGMMYRADFPVYTLIPKSDPNVKLPYFRAVPAPWGMHYTEYTGIGTSQFGPSIQFHAYDKGWTEMSWVASLEKVEGAQLSDGDVVVDADEPRESGKPMPLGSADEGAACTPDSYNGFYGDNDAGKFDRYWLPIEFELEKANLAVNGKVARVHSGSVGGMSFSTAMDNAKDGRNLKPAERFVQATREETRTAAGLYYNQAVNGGEEFSPFERRFLRCRAGLAGVSAEFMQKVADAQADPGAFVKSWREFIRAEVHHYLDEVQPPPTVAPDTWGKFDVKPDWDDMVSRTKEWLAGGKLSAAPTNPEAKVQPPRQIGEQAQKKIDETEKSILDRIK